ncbi:MAG: beta-ketoacyl synthase [Flavobacteriales bacterium]|nr:MAG: beta-ketoacyl synthase [Flavobacteriales bacterium]
MDKTYLSYNNIISNLGFSTAKNAENVLNKISGVAKHTHKSLPFEYMAAIVDRNTLRKKFEELANPNEYTKLEQMIICSVQDVISQAKLNIDKYTGLLIATTKGNIDVLYGDTNFDKSKAYLPKLGKTIQRFFNFSNTPIILSNACVSGVLALAIADRLIKDKQYKNVIVTGGDLASAFVLSGFNAFQAMSDEICRPFSKNRKGINIGDAAASVLVTNASDMLSPDAVELIGAASCNDANHISGPSRTGEGLYQSITEAMNKANINAGQIDYISAHGTATLYNDEMEAIALNRSGLQEIPVNSLKAYYGHTLGTAGLVETIIGMQSLMRNMLFTSLGFDEPGVSQPLNIIENPIETPLRIFLKTASGFGGCNTAAVFRKVSV